MTKNRSAGARDRVLVAAPPGSGAEPVAAALEAAGYKVVTAVREADALEALGTEAFSAAFAVQKLGKVAVGSIIARAAHLHPAVPVVVLGADGSVQEAVDAMQQGAAEYLPLPVEPAVLLERVRKALDAARAPPQEAPAPPSPTSGLIGSSEAIRRVLATVEKIARYKTNVLLLGESGTGKELIARALHARGPRRRRLFVPLNCATLGHDILENELFGHEKGAFTGANELKQGLFELADGGTLFLDEIAEMDLATQAKLLRVLERNEFRRVGGMHKVRVDLGVIAATNRNLEDDIRAGRFREDLYYRLKVVTISVPPLRKRKEDIPALIEAFIADFNRRNDGKIRGLAPQALKLLMEHDWPGNVRELKNAIDSAAILASGETIDADALADSLPSTRKPAAQPIAPGARAAAEASAAAPEARPSSGATIILPVGTTLAAAERELILATLKRSRTNAEAAHMLGIGLRTLYTKLRGYGIPRRAESA